MELHNQDTRDRTAVIEHLCAVLDRHRHRASSEGRELFLTLTQFRILECLLTEPGRVFTRRQLIQATGKSEEDIENRSIDHHIMALRRKLGRPELIETVRGVGLRFCERLREAS